MPEAKIKLARFLYPWSRAGVKYAPACPLKPAMAKVGPGERAGMASFNRVGAAYALMARARLRNTVMHVHVKKP